MLQAVLQAASCCSNMETRSELELNDGVSVTDLASTSTNGQLLVKIKQTHRKPEYRIQAGWNDDSEDRNPPDENQHEDLQEALQPHVQEEDDGQEVRRHPQEGQPPHLPRSQELAQEEDRDEETQEDFLTVEKRSDTSPLQDYPLSQGALPNRSQRKKPSQQVLVNK